MIYIVGYTFQFDVRRRQSAGTSIQEQMAISRRNTQTCKQSSIFDSRFIPGNVYKISRIRHTTTDNTLKVQYLFANLSNPKLPDIDVILDNTVSGDDYVAAISGKQQQLENERNLIISANMSNNDV